MVLVSVVISHRIFRLEGAAAAVEAVGDDEAEDEEAVEEEVGHLVVPTGA